MQKTTCRVVEIDNGFVVETFPAGNPGPAKNQFCADLNAAATYLLSVFVPGATFTPPPAATTTTTTSTSGTTA